MLERKIGEDFTVERSKDTVWINGKNNCLGRFSPNGWEINREMKPQEELNPTGNAIVVRVKNTDLKEWNDFQLLMKEHHNIDISAEEYPGDM